MALDAETRDQLIGTVRRFVSERLRPLEAQVAETDAMPADVVEEMKGLGLFGLSIPAEYGGLELSMEEECLVAIELGRTSPAFRSTFGTNVGIGSQGLVMFGTPEQKAKYLPGIASGEIITSFALTEPEAGSDAAALRTRAQEGRITGAKQWITNGSHAHTFCVFARDDAAGDRVSAWIVRRGAPGFRPVREEDKLGLNSSSTADLSFQDTPAERLREPGDGMRIALATLDGGRIGIAAQAVGIAQAALDLAVAHARERRAFGRPIGALGAIQQKLADMQTEIEAARALTWRAARLKDAGRPHGVEGAQAKLLASRVARAQTAEAIQVLGGYGYTRELPAERFYRDAKATEIYEGTSEIQRLVIARALLGDAARP